MTEQPPVGTRELRRFAAIVAAGMAILGTISFVRHGSSQTVMILWSVAVVLVLAGLVAPRTLGPVHRAWMTLGHALGWVNTRIILGLVFFGLCLPIGRLLRLTGRDVLQLRRRPVDSHWVVRSPLGRAADRYRRMF